MKFASDILPGRRSLPLLGLLLLAAGLCVGAPAHKPAAAPTTRTRVGPVVIDTHRFEYAGSTLRFFDGVQMTSATFELHAVELKVLFMPAKTGGGMAVTQAAADGDKSTQVTGVFKQIEEGRTIRMRADHAVYVPDASRPAGGRIDFTGHVVMAVSAPAALDGPSTMHMERAVVLLGKGPEYPRVEGDNGHITLTPLQ